jgi:hypothetical protein
VVEPVPVTTGDATPAATAQPECHDKIRRALQRNDWKQRAAVDQCYL